MSIDNMTNEKVASIIRETRRTSGITQQQLADRVGVTKSYISRIEGGSVEPSAGLFLRIIDALGLKIGKVI